MADCLLGDLCPRAPSHQCAWLPFWLSCCPSLGPWLPLRLCCPFLDLPSLLWKSIKVGFFLFWIEVAVDLLPSISSARGFRCLCYWLKWILVRVCFSVRTADPPVLSEGLCSASLRPSRRPRIRWRAHSAICVRVVRLWDYCGNKEDQLPLHVDVVMVDEKGNRMYAEIPGAEADRFKSLISEGRVYVFRKFVVTACKPAYKPFESSQMIRFTPWTTVEEKTEMADRLPKYVFDLVDFEDFPSRVGQVGCFVDAIGIIVGVSEVAYVHLPSNHDTTAKRVIALKDLRNNQINLVLWGSRAIDFDAEGVHYIGQESPVVAIFVGMLLKSYKAENTLSGGSACKWYINEDIPEIEAFFERMFDVHAKIEWISAGEQHFRGLE